MFKTSHYQNQKKMNSEQTNHCFSSESLEIREEREKC